MTGLFTDSSCEAQHGLKPGDVIDLTRPVDVEGVIRFQRTLFLKIPVDGDCLGVTFSPDSRLELRFEPTQKVVNRTDTDWVKTWDANSRQIRIELVYPAPILSMHSMIYGKVAVHRVDGDVVSEQATVTADTGQVFSEPLTAPAFQVVLSEGKTWNYATTASREIGNVGSQTHISRAAAPGTGMTATEMAEAAGHAGMEIHAQEILSAIVLQGQPVNPSLSLLNEDSSEILWQWLESGIHTDTVPFSHGSEELHNQMGSALNRALGKRKQAVSSGQPIPDEDSIILPFVLENDAPCQVEVDQSDLILFMETELVSAPIRFQFDGSRTETRRIPLDLPAGTLQRLFFDGTIDLPQPWQTTPPPLSTGTESIGISLSKGDKVSAPIQADQPLKLGGLALAWYNLAEQSELKVSLSPDSGGGPAAGPQGESVQTGTGNTGEWLYFPLEEIHLQPGRYWITLRLLEGSGVWLGQPVSSVQPILQEKEGRPEQKTAVPLQLHTWPLTRSSELTSAPIQIGINGNTIPHTTASANTIAGELMTIPSALQSLTSWEFKMTCSQSLDITIKSIRIVYLVDDSN